MFCCKCNQSWIFAVDFNGSSQYQIAIKSVEWELNCFVRKDGNTKCQTGGYDEGVSCFSSLRKRTRNNTNIKAFHYLFFCNVTCSRKFWCDCGSAVESVAYNRIYHSHLPNSASHKTLRLHCIGFTVKETSLVQPEVIDFTSLKIPGYSIWYKVSNYVNQ